MRVASYSVPRVGAQSSARYTFAHEIAHSLGAAHDVSLTGTGWTNNARGYWLPIEAPNLTIMHGMGFSEDRILHLSNPDVEFNGVATGTANANNAAALFGSRNNASSISDARWFAASDVNIQEWRGGTHWFGWFWAGQYPHLWHQNAARWLWVATNDANNLWFYDYSSNKWTWSSETYWPWVLPNGGTWQKLY